MGRYKLKRRSAEDGLFSLPRNRNDLKVIAASRNMLQSQQAPQFWNTPSNEVQSKRYPYRKPKEEPVEDTLYYAEWKAGGNSAEKYTVKSERETTSIKKTVQDLVVRKLCTRGPIIINSMSSRVVHRNRAPRGAESRRPEIKQETATSEKSSPKRSVGESSFLGHSPVQRYARTSLTDSPVFSRPSIPTPFERSPSVPVVLSRQFESSENNKEFRPSYFSYRQNPVNGNMPSLGASDSFRSDNFERNRSESCFPNRNEETTRFPALAKTRKPFGKADGEEFIKRKYNRNFVCINRHICGGTLERSFSTTGKPVLENKSISTTALFTPHVML